MNTPDCVAIVSGGMDSVTLLHYLVKTESKRPAVVSFQYGQKHARELACAAAQAKLLGCERQVFDLTSLSAAFASSALVASDQPIPDVETVLGDPQPPTYVPNRNMVFLALAAAYAESLGLADVYYGAQRHDIYGYFDTTPQFVQRLNEVFALNRKMAIQICTPFVSYSKADILRIGLPLGVDYGQTWSCYAGQEKACGRCPTCAERLTAFQEVGVSDPLPYMT